MKKLLCALFGHRWDHTLGDVGQAWFYRIDCLRCGEAVDGVACKSLYERVPELYRMAGLPKP